MGNRGALRMSGTRMMAPPALATAADTPLRRALRACRKQFLLVGLFSGAVNLLQLTTSLYMMQVFDRVLTTRVLDTLLYLSDRKSTRLNSSHANISYAVFCLKKKKLQHT